MMISSSDKATDYRKAPLEGTIVSELGGAPSAASVGGGRTKGPYGAGGCGEVRAAPVSYTNFRAHETPGHSEGRLLLEKKKHRIT